MQYIELRVSVNPRDPWSDVIVTELADIGFDSFVDTESGFTAYIPEKLYIKDLPEQIVERYAKKVKIALREKILPKQNWNEEWERNFQPVEIAQQLYIRAEFHPSKPDFKYEIVIQPKMSFGTGHHETTSLVAAEMLNLDFKQKTVLDMGSGTGLLAILAEKLGAKSVLAIDIDEWCLINSQENIAANQCTKTKVLMGGKEKLGKEKFNTVIANINRNILLDMAKELSASTEAGGTLILSGFYLEDLAVLINEFTQYGFAFLHNSEKNKWVAAVFEKGNSSFDRC